MKGGDAMTRTISSIVAILLIVFPLTVCTGGVGWAQAIDWSKPYARMSVGIVGGGTTAAEAPSGTWYGPSQTWGDSNESGAALCEQISVSSSGSLSKVAVWIVDKQSANIKIALYNGDGSSLLSSGCAVANASISDGAWLTCAITGVSVTSGDTVMPCIRMDSSITYNKTDAATNTGRYAGVTYATFPAATINDEDSDAYQRFRVCVGTCTD